MTNPAKTSEGGVSRREFISNTLTAGAGLLVGATALGRADDTASRKRYALVGVGSRSSMYRDAILKTYAEHCQMVGFCDVNEGRLKLAQRKAHEAAGADVPIFDAKDFDRMIRETKPDIIIVTTKDATHDGYIIRAMELGCDVMTEKPMTTDEKKCRAILQTQ